MSAPQKKKSGNKKTKDLPESNVNLKYALPAAIGTAGIIATPFIIAALGGKRKKRKKNKTIKKKNKNKN